MGLVFKSYWEEENGDLSGNWEIIEKIRNNDIPNSDIIKILRMISRENEIRNTTYFNDAANPVLVALAESIIRLMERLDKINEK